MGVVSSSNSGIHFLSDGFFMDVVVVDWDHFNGTFFFDTFFISIFEQGFFGDGSLVNRVLCLRVDLSEESAFGRSSMVVSTSFELPFMYHRMLLT